MQQVRGSKVFDNAMVVNGWNLYVADIFENQLDKLVKEVEVLAEKDPEHFYNHPKCKLLFAIQDNIYRKIPLNPNDVKYRLGGTLGKKHSHWRRVKKNNLPDRYRLFFQFRSDSKTIIYAWFNDESSLRKEGAKTDVYTVFEAMLKNGNPPSTWEALTKQASSIKKRT